MSPHMILFIAGIVAVGAALLTIALSRNPVGSAALAAALFGGFAAFTAVTIWSEGLMLVVENHTINLWGIQVWYDLLLSVGIALFFIVPRARKAGMPVLPWVAVVALTASIGLLAMIARLFWLEAQQTSDVPEAEVAAG